MNYYEAKKIGDRIVEILSPHTTIINIAGSVRREKAEVKDIEVCCIPKEEFVVTDLFGGGSVHRTAAFTKVLDTFSNKIIKGKPTGRYMQIEIKGYPGLMLDLFMPQPTDYYRQYAIRTGSADYSFKVIANSWNKLGWVGTRDGLRKQYECEQDKQENWKCVVANPQLPPIWESEEAFFKWLGITCLHPRLRII